MNVTKKERELGVIRSLFVIIWLPSILAFVAIHFGKTFADAGMPKDLLIIFWITITIVLVLIKIQEIQNIKKQTKKKNWF